MEKQRRHLKSKQRTRDYVETSDQAKRSAATKARLGAAIAATKLYQVYKHHPLASRIMTFKEFRISSRRNRILKSFLTAQSTTKADGNSQ